MQQFSQVVIITGRLPARPEETLVPVGGYHYSLPQIPMAFSLGPAQRRSG